MTSRLPLFITLLLSFALRLHRLGDRSVWWDEGLAAWAARQPLGQLTNWTAHDVHPPLYFALLHFWRLVSGDSEFGLRLFSAVLGTCAVAATYLLGRKVGGQMVGWLAALFLGVSRFAIDWSQEMRMYTLTALLSALVLWAVLGLWQQHSNGRFWKWGAVYVLLMTAGLYSLYLFALILVVANLVWLAGFAKTRSSADFWRWSGLQTAVLLLYAPWLSYALGKIPTWSSATPVAFIDFLKIYWTTLTVGIPLDVESYYPWTLPIAGLFLLGTAVLFQNSGKQKNGRSLFLLLLTLWLPAIVVYIVSLPRTSFFYAPPLAPRYLLMMAPAYSVLLAWGICVLAGQLPSFGRRLLPMVYQLVFATAVLYVAWVGLRSYHPGRVLRDDYISLAVTLAVYRQPNDAVVLHNDTDWPIFAYHYPDVWRGIPKAWTVTPETAENFLAPIWQEYEGVWLVLTPYAAVNDPANEMATWLAARAQASVEYPYEDKLLRFYARTPERAALIHELVGGKRPFYPLAGTILAGYDQFAHDLQSGDTLHLFLYWHTLAETAEIGLQDTQGERWQPQQITAHSMRQQIDFLLSPDTPPGDYTFYVETDHQAASFGHFSLRAKGGAVLTTADVSIPSPLTADFEQNIRLLGYSLDTPTLQPGQPVYLTLYWQTTQPVPQRYKVFTHLLGDVFNANTNNFLWGQQDNEPVSNTRPTTTWRSGEVIVDSYAIPTSFQTPAGIYTIEIGLYNPVTGQRLLVTRDGETADHLILTTIK